MASPAAPSHDTKVLPRDAGLAVLLAVFCVLVGRKQPLTFPDARPADTLQAIVITLTCLPLTVRRPLPVAAAMSTCVGGAVYLALGYTGGPILLVPLVAMYLAGYALPRRRLWQMLAAYTVAMAVAAILTTAPAAQVWVWLLAWPPLAGALAFGGNARHRYETDEAERAEEEDRRQHAEARQQLAEERLQMARDLHDVLGHSLASITILAGAGSRRVDADPASAKEVLDEIRAISATALSDVRQALDALNDPTQAILDDSDADLGRLVERLRRVGLRIDDRVEVDLGALDPPVAAAVHRIAQESLTNVMRHAGSLHAAIGVVRSGTGVELTVSDRGRGGGEIVEGLGIAGMRQRAEELGGQLSVGWAPAGGLVVSAWIPASESGR